MTDSDIYLFGKDVTSALFNQARFLRPHQLQAGGNGLHLIRCNNIFRILLTYGSKVNQSIMFVLILLCFGQAKVAALDNAGFYDPFHAEKARQGADKMNNIIAMYTR